MDNQNTDVTQDEQNAENEILAEAKVEEVRTKIVSELGLSEEDNKELVDKLVTREIDSHKKLSTAVRQKIDYRTKFQDSTKAPDAEKKTAKTETLDAEQVRKEAESATMATLEKRDLDEMTYSDSIKEQIKQVSRLNNVSVRKAAEDSYIQHLVGEETKQRENDEAADNGSSRGKSGVKIDISKPLDPAQFNLSTEEGRKAWKEAKTAKHSTK